MYIPHVLYTENLYNVQTNKLRVSNKEKKYLHTIKN